MGDDTTWVRESTGDLSGQLMQGLSSREIFDTGGTRVFKKKAILVKV